MTKYIFFTIYLLAVALLIALPINDRSSWLNHTYWLTIRLDHMCHILLFIPWMFYYPLLRHARVAHQFSLPGWFITGLAFSAVVELIQYVLPYRSMNAKDLVSNLAGVVIGGFMMVLTKKLIRNSEATHH